jgi:outer membrane beta-barrel protein
MRRFVRTVLAVVAAAGALSTASTASAQEIELTGPLKGAPAVRNLRLYREGRFELAPTASFTLLDEYRRTILFGARLNYNIKDWIAIGVWGAFGAISSNTSLASAIDATSPRDDLTAINVNHNGNPSGQATTPGASFTNQTAKMNYLVAPQLTFVPFRGKLAIFNKIFVDSDLYLAAGGAIVGIQERGDCVSSNSGASGGVLCTDPASFGLTSKTKIAPTFGVGFNFYPGNWVSIGVEYRALPFSWNRAGFDSRGAGTNGNFPDQQVNSKDETFKFNQMMTISVGFSLPTAPKISE